VLSLDGGLKARDYNTGQFNLLQLKRDLDATTLWWTATIVWHRRYVLNQSDLDTQIVQRANG
jgi:hypothetical protein